MSDSQTYLQVGNLRIADKQQIPYLKADEAEDLSGDIINWLRMGVPCVQVQTVNGCLTGRTRDLANILQSAAVDGEKFQIYGTKVQISERLTLFFVKRIMPAQE